MPRYSVVIKNADTDNVLESFTQDMRPEFVQQRRDELTKRYTDATNPRVSVTISELPPNLGSATNHGGKAGPTPPEMIQKYGDVPGTIYMRKPRGRKLTFVMYGARLSEAPTFVNNLADTVYFWVPHSGTEIIPFVSAKPLKVGTLTLK